MNLTSGTISAKFNCVGTNATGVSTPTDSMVLSLDSVFAQGTSTAQGNQLYSKRQTNLAASAADTLDFNASTLTDGFGALLNFTRIKAVLIINTGTVAITVGGANTSVPPTASPITIGVGGMYLSCRPDSTGYAVGVGADTIIITNSSGSTAAAYDLAVLGTV